MAQAPGLIPDGFERQIIVEENEPGRPSKPERFKMSGDP